MSRKTNRDHAKKKQRPMVEDQVIAEHLRRRIFMVSENEG